MDVGKSIGYVFEDKKWIDKLLIGMLVSIVPIVNFALFGWVIDIMRNVSQRQSEPLPAWENFGDKFVKGLILFVVGLIYMLPALLVSCVAIGLPALNGGLRDVSQRELAGMFFGTFALSSCTIFVYSLLISFLMPAIFLNFARKGTFAACFEFGEIWRIMSRNLGDYLVAWLIIIVISIAASTLISIVTVPLMLILCLGWILAAVLAGVVSVWTLTVFAHLFGQIGAEPPDQSLTPTGF